MLVLVHPGLNRLPWSTQTDAKSLKNPESKSSSAPATSVPLNTQLVVPEPTVPVMSTIKSATAVVDNNPTNTKDKTTRGQFFMIGIQ
jgi:hypothetical protein